MKGSLSLALGQIERLVNLALRLDPHTQAALAVVKGRSLGITIQGLSLSFVMRFTAQGVELQPELDECDCHLSGPPFILLRLLATKDKSLLQHEALSLEGDPSLLTEVTAALEQFEFDWEEHLSKWTGDVLAHALGNQVQNIHSWQQSCQQAWENSLREYLQEEAKLLAPRLAITDYINDINELRLSQDRLSARIERLEQQRLLS